MEFPNHSAGQKNWFKRFIQAVADGWAAFAAGWIQFWKTPLKSSWKAIKYLYKQLGRLLKWVVNLPVRLVKFLIGWFANLTGRTVWRIFWKGSVGIAVLLGVGLFAAVHWPHSQVPEVQPADQIVYLDQGWGIGREAENRQLFYFTPQGAGNVLKNMRYDWFVNLELPWGENRLADPDNMLAYGFQVDAEPTAANPHQLPVGFAKHYDPRFGEQVLDITCAACHTGSLLVGKDDGTTVSIRIDGGQGMHAFTAANMPHFVPVMLASMTSTLVNPIKFNRFALNVLGAEHYREGKAALRTEFKKTFFALLNVGIIEKSHDLVTVQEGYARTDALTRIGNAVFGDHITENNYKKVNAPVNYPPVWDIWKFDWVQYSGSVAQPMARNLGESLGVGATYDFFDTYMRPIPDADRYWTSTRMPDLHNIEEALRELRPPVWQEDLLGKIDMDKAAKGGLAFIRTCQGCHGPHPASLRQKTLEAPGKSAAQPHWKMKLLSAYEIGTDPTAAVNFVRRTFDLTDTGLSIEEVKDVVGHEMNLMTDRELAYDFKKVHDQCKALPRVIAADKCDAWEVARKTAHDKTTQALDSINLREITNGQALNYFGLLMKRLLYAEGKYSKEEQAKYNGFGALDLPQVKLVYKARPLGGVWATAPYIHNGSVRNLYQMLVPQHERDRKFFIGRPEFDPVQVGFKLADKKDGGFWLDTSINGNANTGHEFRAGYTQWQPGNAPQFGVIGPAYTPDERYEIIEYIKVHLDDPPHSKLLNTAFTGIVASVLATMPQKGNEMAIADSWPLGQACNLREYLANHVRAKGLPEKVTKDVETIQELLNTYFEKPKSYNCGGKTRYQRGGEAYASD
jgi:mono/diheme cytochrome c family protein